MTETVVSFARTVCASLPDGHWCIADVEGLDDGETGAPAEFASLLSRLLGASVPGCLVEVDGDHLRLCHGGCSTRSELITRDAAGLLAATNGALATAGHEVRVFTVWSADLGQSLALFVATEAVVEPSFEELMTRPDAGEDLVGQRDQLSLHLPGGSRLV